MAHTTLTTSRLAYHAYQVLCIGFIVAPFLPGLDRFTHVLTNWDRYLPPVVAGLALARLSEEFAGGPS